MEKPKVLPEPAYKRYLKLLIKLGLTSLALYLVFRKVDLQEIGNILRQADFFWLLPALLFFVAAKVFNALRLQAFFDSIGLHLQTFYNLKLYLVGLFYNLFLPGGIGGDGYKVILLRKAEGVSTRALIVASLLDRVSGVVALGFLALSAMLFSHMYASLTAWQWLIWASILVAFPLYYLLLKIAFPKFLNVYLSSCIYSLIVQLLTMGSILTILLALNVSSYYADYYVLFMLASLAAMLPFTIGGVGAREAVLVFVPQLIDSAIAQDTAVTLSLLFFLITVITSVWGAFVKLEEPERAVSVPHTVEKRN